MKEEINTDEQPTRKTETARQWIGSGLSGINARFRNYVDTQGRKIPPRRILVSITAFCLVSFAYSIWTVYRSIKVPQGNMELNMVKQNLHPFIKRQPLVFDGLISDDEYGRVEGFRRYMDSLSRDSVGRSKYRQIVSLRPGLMDSIALFEKTYEKQKRH